MTVSTEVNQAAYTGNGVTTVFPYTFRILNASNLTVTRIDLLEVETVLTLGTDYTVTGAGTYNGGAVTLPVPLPNGYGIIIERDLDVVQETDLRNQGTFFAEVHEDVFDYLTMLIQQAFGWIGLALRRPNSRSSFYDAKQYRIANMADPINEQDAVNNRSMRRYVESVVAGIVGGFGWFVQSGAGAIGRTFQDKLRDWISVKDFGAQQSSPDNTQAFFNAKLQSGGDSFLVPPGTLNIGITDPDYYLNGVGNVTASSITFGLDDLSYNAAKENVIYAPGTYLREKTGEPYPTRENPLHLGQCYRFVLSQGSNLDDETKSIHHVVAVGNTIGCSPLDWQLVDAFGGNALMYAGRVSRTTAIGSESMAWFGAPDQQWLIDKCHDYWRKPAANPYLPGEPGWDSGGLETNFPGMGARLAAYNNYVTSSDDAGYCASLGRDAMNHIVRGVRNASGGYQSMAYSFDVSYCTAFGALALQSMVFGGYNTAVGDSAGRLANDCYNTTFIGYGAGRSVRGATGSVFIGDRTADSVLSATKAVIIGPEAGSQWPVSLDNKFLLANAPSGGISPLMSGNFSTALAGVNVTPEKLRAHFHVRDTDSGSTLTPPVGLLVEAGGVAAVTIESRNNGFCSVRFADPEASNSGYIEYGHSGDSMTFGTASTARWRIENTGAYVPMVDNAYTVGRAAFRPSVIFAGTATINTSDETMKDRLTIEDAEREAALEIKKDIWKYKFKEADAQKDGKGRLHFGVGAQSVGEVLKKHGLIPEDYAFYCYDEWDDEFEPVYAKRTVQKEIKVSKIDAITGYPIETTDIIEVLEDYDTGEKRLTLAAGSRYGIRYEELLCFIIAAI